MRGTLGLRVPVTLPPPPAAPTINRCASTASWSTYAGAVQYDLQWAVGAGSNSPGSPTTVANVTSGVTVPFTAQTEANQWFFVRIRAVITGSIATDWSEWTAAERIGTPSPPTASLSVGPSLTVAAPSPPTVDSYSITAYDAEVQYAYGTSSGTTGSWAAFTEWYEVPIANSVTYSNPPTGVWYRARVRLRGTRCGSAWVGEWGSWSTSAYGGASGAGGGDAIGGD